MSFVIEFKKTSRDKDQVLVNNYEYYFKRANKKSDAYYCSKSYSNKCKATIVIADPEDDDDELE